MDHQEKHNSLVWGTLFECKQLNSVQGENFTGEDAARLQSQFNTKVTDTVKKDMTNKHKEEYMEKMKSLVVQGNTLALADAKATDFTWKNC